MRSIRITKGSPRLDVISGKETKEATYGIFKLKETAIESRLWFVPVTGTWSSIKPKVGFSREKAVSYLDGLR